MDKVDIIRNIGTKKKKQAYIATLSPQIRDFLGANISIVGIGPEIFDEINMGHMSSTLEYLIDAFDTASKISSSIGKRAIIHGITLTQNEKDFVGSALYGIGGNLGLGVTIHRVNSGIGDIISPMLAKAKDFDPSQYQIEPKLDGYRLIARKVDGEVSTQSRNGKPLVVEKITAELERCLPEGTVIDGEVLALNGDFQSLKRHGNDVQYTVFDVLYHDNRSIMETPLTHRREKLEGLDLDGRINIPEILDFNTLDEIDVWIRASGEEGIVAKDVNSTYKPKNRGWIKRKLMNDLNARIVGMTEGTGKRKGMLGALIVQPEGLGGVQTKVGTGYSDAELETITQRVNTGEQLNCVVRYQDITRDQKLRFPVFVRLI